MKNFLLIFSILFQIILTILSFQLGEYFGKVQAIKEAVKLTENVKRIKGDANDLIRDFNKLYKVQSNKTNEEGNIFGGN